MANPLGSRSGMGLKPSSIMIALSISLVLLALFDLLSHTHL